MVYNKKTKISFLANLQNVPCSEVLFSYFLSLFYPLLMWLLHKDNKDTKKHIHYIMVGFGVLLFVVGSFGIETIFNLFGMKVVFEFPGNFLFTCLFTALFNVLLYFILLIIDLPALLYHEFYSAGKDAVSDWLESVIGHKLWSGPNTHKLLEHILKENFDLGRAKWLLVNFLSEDIDKKIHEIKPQRGNTANGKVQILPSQDEPMYEITVRDWSIYTYSNFLSNNMNHARNSIHWVVDPIDLMTQIIPSHVIEVIISIGSIIHEDIKKKLDEVKQVMEKNELPVSWSNLLGDYVNWCPKYLLDKKCNKKHEDCEEIFPFRDEPIHRQLEYIWYALFAGSLNDLKNAKIEKDKIFLGTKKIKYDDVEIKYIEREAITGALALPHISEFRKASCNKKRHIYLGLKPSSSEKDITQKAVENLKKYISKSEGNYIQAISPDFNRSDLSKENSLFLQLLRCKDKSADWITPQGDENLWLGVQKNIMDLVLLWALKLFSYTSGGEDIIKGVYVNNNQIDLPYEACYDIGFYDELLVLSSGRGSNRSVKWTVYQKVPTLEKIFFPEKESDLLVPFKKLIEIIIKVLNESKNR